MSNSLVQIMLDNGRSVSTNLLVIKKLSQFSGLGSQCLCYCAAIGIECAHSWNVEHLPLKTGQG